MKIYVNDKSSNMLALLKSKVVPRVGDELVLRSVNKILLVKEVFYQFDKNDKLESITLYVVDNQHVDVNEDTIDWTENVY